MKPEGTWILSFTFVGTFHLVHLRISIFPYLSVSQHWLREDISDCQIKDFQTPPISKDPAFPKSLISIHQLLSRHSVSENTLRFTSTSHMWTVWTFILPDKTAHSLSGILLSLVHTLLVKEEQNWWNDWSVWANAFLFKQMY